MERYPSVLSTLDYEETDCYRAGAYVYSQLSALGGGKKFNIAPTLWEITEAARDVKCLPVISLMPYKAALAILEPTEETPENKSRIDEAMLLEQRKRVRQNAIICGACGVITLINIISIIFNVCRIACLID